MRRQDQIAGVMYRVRNAELRASATPTPERITMALDLRDLYGPEVDEALGGQEPMVDEWESGRRVPTKEQIQALAWLTDFPVTFFYLPPPRPLPGLIICGDDGCQVTEDTP
jgi:DNA-binding transcriptional regulator YiaG